VEAGHSLLLEFSNTERDFALGFECGRTWAILDGCDDPFDCEMHVENAEMILRLAEATGRTVQSQEHDETWLTVQFSERA
jgi:hypothetical protein